MRRCLIAAVILVWPTTAALAAAQTAYEVEYIQGHAGLHQKVKGRLLIDTNTVAFNGKDGLQIMAVPMSEIIEVSNSFQNDPGSFGRKLALGIFASRRAEYLYVNSRSSDQVEVLVFKTKKNMSPEMVAKIRHRIAPPPAATPAANTSADTTVTSPADSATVGSPATE